MLNFMKYPSLRAVRSALVAAALAGLPACGGDSPTGPSSSGKITGTYTLEAVDHEDLPGTVHRGAYLDPETGIFFNNYVVQVKSGYMEIRENETFYMAMEIKVVADGQTAEGTFEIEGEWDEVKEQVVLRIKQPWPGIANLEREGSLLHTDIDFGFDEEVHLDFELWKRS